MSSSMATRTSAESQITPPPSFSDAFSISSCDAVFATAGPGEPLFTNLNRYFFTDDYGSAIPTSTYYKLGASLCGYQSGTKWGPRTESLSSGLDLSITCPSAWQSAFSNSTIGGTTWEHWQDEVTVINLRCCPWVRFTADGTEETFHWTATPSASSTYGIDLSPEFETFCQGTLQTITPVVTVLDGGELFAVSTIMPTIDTVTAGYMDIYYSVRTSSFVSGGATWTTGVMTFSCTDECSIQTSVSGSDLSRFFLPPQDTDAGGLFGKIAPALVIAVLIAFLLSLAPLYIRYNRRQGVYNDALQKRSRQAHLRRARATL